MKVVSSGEDRRQQLSRRFQKQQIFSQASSPLSASICGALVEIFSSSKRGDEEIVNWLIAASQKQTSFAVPMLLLAALHYEILLGKTGFAQLAKYYPSVGGSANVVPVKLVKELKHVLLNNKESLGKFIASYSVQTNETARGLCWLLPLCSVHWAEIALLDLGCSAGLNLVAERRGYILEQDGRAVHLGYGKTAEFSVLTKGNFILPHKMQLPKICGRFGCDLNPFFLRSQTDEARLASFVWGDQSDRMQRLQEGMAAFYDVNQSTVPVQLFQTHLPSQLPMFLQDIFPQPDIPIVIYNTYLRPYLEDAGGALGGIIRSWAATHDQPVLWLQWEIPEKGIIAPSLGWLAWTAELLGKNNSQKWLLGWVHPHGLEVQWAEEMDVWEKFWSV